MNRSDGKVKQFLPPQYTVRFTLSEPYKLKQKGYHTDISYMSGGLEHKLYTILAKVYNKVIYKLSKYKKNRFD